MSEVNDLKAKIYDLEQENSKLKEKVLSLKKELKISKKNEKQIVVFKDEQLNDELSLDFLYGTQKDYDVDFLCVNSRNYPVNTQVGPVKSSGETNVYYICRTCNCHTFVKNTDNQFGLHNLIKKYGFKYDTKYSAMLDVNVDCFRCSGVKYNMNKRPRYFEI